MVRVSAAEDLFDFIGRRQEPDRGGAIKGVSHPSNLLATLRLVVESTDELQHEPRN